MSRALRVVVVLGLAGGALTACGGSSAKSSTRNASTTTAAPARPTATADDVVAAKAALSLADVGAGFAGYRKAAGAGSIGATSCSVTAPGAFLTKEDRS